MNIFNKVISALLISYNDATAQKIIKPFEIRGALEKKNILIRADKGTFYVGQDFNQLKEGYFYFIPAGQEIYLRCGQADNYDVFQKEELNTIFQKAKNVERINPLRNYLPDR